MNKISAHRVYEFDHFRVDVDHLMLSHQGKEISLVPKAVETLIVLIERRGKIVSKDELLEAVWPDAVVEESNLFLYLSVLRKTLGNQKDGRPYVETLRRRGYRFNGDVHPVREELERERYAKVVDEFKQSGGNKITPSGQVYFVKDWERKTESGTTSSKSSAVPALKPVASSNDLMRADNQSVLAALSPTAEISEGPLEHTTAASTGLPGKTEDHKRPRIRYVLGVSLGAILLSVVVAGSFYWRNRRVTATNIGPPKTIAILPFRPLVNENRNEALELGMADTLITRL